MINTLHFDITEFCNYHCEYCYQGVEKTQKHISNEVYDNFFKFLSSQKEMYCVHLIGGEPFLYPRFFEMMQKIIDMGHEIAVTTNFSMPKAIYKKFIDIAKCKISFFEISVHLTQIKDVDELYAKLQWFKECSELDHSKIQINCVLVENNFDEIVKLYKRMKYLGFTVNIQRKSISLGHQEYSKKIEDWLKVEECIDIPLEWARDKSLFDPFTKVCRCGNKFFKIFINGKVKRCFTPQVNAWDELGDLEKSSNIHILPDYAPCYTTNCECFCYRNFKRGKFVFEVQTINRYDIKYDVAISGYGFANNFGAILTNYALMMFLKSIGRNPLMLDKPADLINYAFTNDLYSTGVARRFINKYLYKNISKIYQNKHDLKKINATCDTFIVGSDQTWSNTLYKPAEYFTFLSFVTLKNKKIAYGSSLGYNDWAISPLYNDYERLQMKYALHKFDFISVREDSAAKTLKEQFDLDVCHTLDSVFIAPPSYYNELICNSTVTPKENYMLAYFLDPNVDLRNASIYAKNKLKTDIVTVTDPSRTDYMKILENPVEAEVEDFLKYIKKSNFVLTNSFHGVCFSIIFMKPFLYITDLYRKDWNTRVTSLLKLLRLGNRMTFGVDEVKSYPYFNDAIDYEKVYEILNKQQELSIQWLKTALDTPKIQILDDVESLAILHEKMDYAYDQLQQMSSQQFSNISEDKILLLLNKNVIYRQYYRYKLLSKITFGKKRKHYKEKCDILHKKIRLIRTYNRYKRS